VVDQATSMAQLYDIADRLNPAGMRWAVDGVWVDGPAEEILTAAQPVLNDIPEGENFVLWMLWGRYPPRVDACWSAQAKAYLSPNAGWRDPDLDLQREQWVHGSLGAVQHLSRGLQFSDNNLADRYDLGLSAENLERLEKIRAAYDPEGLFRSYMTPDESTTAYSAFLAR
jgi:FAD/FMN-containing dehydrogenase